MNETQDPDSDRDRLRDLPLRAEDIGFAPEALLECGKCGRRNSPNRAECIYCGTPLEGSTAEAKFETRELESWEKGFNVVLSQRENFDVGPAAKMLASALGGDADDYLAILDSTASLPVARLASEPQAGMLVEKLAEFRVTARVVSDEHLSTNVPPVRLRSLDIDDEKLTVFPFNGGPSSSVDLADVEVIVAGSICESKTESVEKRKGKVTTAVSGTHTSTDESVIDIYTRSDNIGWRVVTSGFDFSCLGDEKALLAADNIERLLARLEKSASNATVVTDYANVSSLLESCWPMESRKDGIGFKRAGLLRKDLASVYTTSNSLQLLKYSRLCRHLV